MNNLISGCLPCDILAGKRIEPGGVLYEDAHWHVGMKMGPVFWPGFLIVKLKRHCEHMAALTPAEANLLGPLLRHSCQAVSNVLNPAKVYVCSFGDGVHHIHFWILPRPVEMRPGMHWTILNLDLRTLLTDRLGIKRWQCNQGEVADLADMLRQQYHLLRQDDFTSIAG